MPEQPQQPSQPADDRQANRTLSEISHLFLSSIREKQASGSASGSARPVRVPPSTTKAPDPVVDLTPEEFAEVFGEPPISERSPRVQTDHPTDATADRMPPVQAMVVAHLNGHSHDRVREYAAHLCKAGQRVGVIYVDAHEFSLTCFELGNAAPHEQANASDQLDGRRMSEALEELNWDVDRWILHVANPRATEARALLRLVDQWTVLATCDHDGVVSCYRTLKGLADLHTSDGHVDVPNLSLSLLDAHDEMVSMRVFRKLAGVCQQFLHWPLESEEPTQAAGSIVENTVLSCRATRDKAQLASAPQWQVVADFLTRCRASGSTKVAPNAAAVSPVSTTRPTASSRTATTEPANMSIPMQNPAPSDTSSEVIDLPAGLDGSVGTIVSAAVRGGNELVELPVKPPMLSEGSLAVARDRRLVLLAVARQGLSDLRAIGEAYLWMNENRALIAMAVPQLSIDAHQLPHLRLLIDRADLSAATLQPLLQSSNVTVHTYRKLRWGAKTGLLLEAA